MFSAFPPARSSLVGQLVGNYRVLSPLGEGGMGAVYLAEHPVIERRAAVKVLHADLATQPEVVQRFWNEARAATAIGHPGIVQVIDFGQTADGQPYLLMEFLDGRSLTQTIKEEGPLAPARAIFIADQIADALAAAHAKSIVHRDLKPDNVFVLGNRVKVLDFGIAKLEQAEAGRTRTGMVLGTPAYMAPEQCEGRPDVDARADVYAMGIVLFEMLTGRLPFSGTFGELVVAHLTVAPPLPSSLNPAVPAALDAVVVKALAKLPEQRFAGMVELQAALRAAALPSPAPGPTRDERRWRRAIWVAAGAALLALGIAVAVQLNVPAPPVPKPPTLTPTPRPRPTQTPTPAVDPPPPPPEPCKPRVGGIQDPFCKEP
jgi:serine/threonine-protein kinase